MHIFIHLSINLSDKYLSMKYVLLEQVNRYFQTSLQRQPNLTRFLFKVKAKDTLRF